MILTNPMFWMALLLIGFVILVVGAKMNLVNNTAFAVSVSTLIVVAFFHLVNHYLMDMQGLDYWYLFRR